jgi:cytochrome c oxidase subunit 2
VWFQATKQDTFQLFCTEYCGSAHSGMLATVVAESQDTFEAWLQSAGAAEDLPLPELGANLYEQQICMQCHTVDGNPGIGPTLQGLFGKTETLQDGSSVQVDENYLRESILEPGAKVVQGYQNIMPAAYGSLSERQVSALIEFIKSKSE